MNDYREESHTITVPANTGVEGFMHTIRELLRRPRLQEIRINAKGTVTYRQYVRTDEPAVANVGIDFEALEPMSIIRNTDLREVPVRPGTNAAIVLGCLLDQAAREQLFPIAFVSGGISVLANWYIKSTGVEPFLNGKLFGLPLLLDRNVPDSALILCAGYGKEAALIDTQRAFKIEMESLGAPPPQTTVEVI